MSKTDFEQLAISSQQAEQYMQQYFGRRATAQKLPGEADFNFKMTGEDGKVYTLKVSRPGIDIAELDMQATIMAYLSAQDFPYQIPALIPTVEGELYTKLHEERNQPRWIRLQRWVSGRMIAEVPYRSPQLLRQWGELAGQLARALQGFDHPAAHRFYPWNPSETLFSRKYQTYIQGKEEQQIADYFWQLFEQETLPKLGALRQSVNYNDAHEHNILVDRDRFHPSICGLIDFGDALYTHTVNELAIACAYACMGLPDPLSAATQLIGGFHNVFPLQEQEVEVLYSLISARLLITVAHAAWNKHREPENAYLQVSEQAAWALLKRWREIPPAFAHYTFRAACGWIPCPAQEVFSQWIKDHEVSFARAVDFEEETIVPIDLSVGSLTLGNNSNFETTQSFDRMINRYLEDQEKEIAVGGYGETRPFYTTDAYQIEGNAGRQWRSVHLGVDFWTGADAPVRALWDGVVHSFADNAGDCNYGPTIILQHKVTDKLTFYSLYGHLTADSLDGLAVGMPIHKGQVIAAIGSPPGNGNWAPHLHLQIMLDMLGMAGDFPGLAFPHEKDVWLSLCPNPATAMPGLPAGITATITSANQILATRQQHLGKSLSISYQSPLHIVRGYRQYLYDSDARRYLDTVNNVAHVGHEHPRVVRAAQRQMAVLNTNTRYLHEQVVRFAEELAATLPPELSVVHFVNSGSEANELALRMVRAYTGQKDMLALEVGYHGNTGGCIDISSYKFDGKGGSGAPATTHILPMPDTYRGLYRQSADAAEKYAEHADRAIESIVEQGRKPGGFIAESIMSCGGQVMLPEGYLRLVYQQVRAAGGLCIADEVQVGFGRVGEAFWGFELQGVVPDIVTMGKPMGNGHPLAAVVTTPQVAEAFANGMEYFNTFGGNPVSCAIGREVLQVIRDEQLQEQARTVGQYLMKALRELQEQHPIIGDVRGIGFFQGFELVRDRARLEPAPDEAHYLANRMRQRGILMSTDGPYHNVLKIKPPMCFNRQNVDFLIDNLDLVFRET